MVRYTLDPTKGFRKELVKLSAVHQKHVLRKALLLAENPYHPSLRTKKLRGSDDLYESSVNMDIRILWEFDDERIRVINLLDVGHHDLLKKY